MRHAGGLLRRDQYGRSDRRSWSRSPFVANTVADECKEIAARALQLNVQCLVPPFHRDVIGDGRSTIP